MKKNWYIFVFIGTVILISLSFSPPRKNTVYVFPKLNYFPAMPLPQEYEITNEGVSLGRYLFYDPILSRDSTFSCASCHQLEYAFSNSPLRFSRGIDGVKQSRNTPPLFNLAWYNRYFWDGRANTLEEQILQPVRKHDEMDLDWKAATQRIKNSRFYRKQFQGVFGNSAIDSTLITYAIAQFERTLISNNSKYDQVLRRETYLTSSEFRGYVLMNDQVKGNCMHCHPTDANALGTTGRFSNNGLDSIANEEDYKDMGLGKISGNKKENGLFKIPSLRNIALTAPYMHDGRFKTLEEVLDFYSEGFHDCINLDPKMMYNNKANRKLTMKEKQDIISFLYALTDSTFITNEAFMNPF